MRQTHIIFLLLFTLFACTDKKEDTDTSEEKEKVYEAVDRLAVKDTTFQIKSDYHSGRFNIPFFTAKNDNPRLDSLIYYELSFYTIAGATINEVVETFKTDGMGLSGFGYHINYNRNGIFDISYYIESTSAYLSYGSVNVTLDLHKMEVVKLWDLIRDEKKGELLAAVQEKFNTNITDARVKALSVESADKELIEDLFTDTIVEVEDLKKFSLQKDYFVVYHTLSFPHFAFAYEPNDIISFTKAAIRPYLNINNPLVQRWLGKEA